MRFFGVFLWLFAFAAQPAAAASSPALRSLEYQLASLLANKSSDVGIAALDLRTGEMVSIKGDEPFPMASTVKIAVAAIYLAQVEHGYRTLDDKIAGQSARRLMERMIIRSDNHATDLLLRDIGGPQALHKWIQDNRLSNMHVDRTIAQLLRAKRDLWDVRDSSTPKAMVELLQRIDSGQLLKPQGRHYLLDLMRRCMTGKNRMKALLPYGTQIEHKTGTLNGYVSDVGIITMPDGRRVAIAAFARGGSDRPRTIAQAARTIYDAFWKKIRWSSALTAG
ncbi:MAG: class A beta-lactamase-related serine hydrolase [Pseudomonadota bacterium]|nr:class A beta-lactamase-related serine hydrolase [Pseudomonadota bacterium]